jgi:hypothetical protein
MFHVYKHEKLILLFAWNKDDTKANNQNNSKMTNNTSMFFPYLKASVDVDQIVSVLNGFHQLGVVGKIDMLARTDKKTGAKYNMAYVHMIEWNTTSPYVQSFLDGLAVVDQPNKLFINEREYWTVLENKYEDKKLTYAPKKAPKPAAEPIVHAVTPLRMEFEEEDTCDLVDATYVWHLETELAKMNQRVSELEHELKVNELEYKLAATVSLHQRN